MPRPSFHICYPGNSIPECFAFSDDETSITIDLLPNWNNVSFLGFVLCVVLGPAIYYRVNCKCSFEKSNGDSIDMECWPSYSDTISTSEHVMLWYDYYLYAQIAEKKDWFSDDFNKVSLEFSGQNFVGKYEWIKKCAVYPLYEKDNSYYYGFNKGEDKRMNSMNLYSAEEIEEDEDLRSWLPPRRTAG